MSSKITDFNKLIEKLDSSPNKLQLIAIDGRPCSGKTTLALKLAQVLTAQLVHLDEFFIPISQWRKNAQPSYPFFYFRFWEFINGIKALAQGRVFSYYAYDPQTNSTSKTITEIKPNGIVIIEGTSVLSAELTSLYSYKIWVESDFQTEWSSLCVREQGVNLDLWQNIYLPSIELYCSTEPWSRADSIYVGRMS